MKLAPPLLLGLVLPLAGGAYAAAGAASAEPAEWRTYDLLVDFQDLPRTYSCDELWYKFRDVLRKLGARAYMTITPYHCGYVGGGEARSPHVEVKFQLPQPLQGAATRYAQLSVVNQPVRLAPGAPRSLIPSDCEFVRQLQGTLARRTPAARHGGRLRLLCRPRILCAHRRRASRRAGGEPAGAGRRRGATPVAAGALRAHRLPATRARCAW